jgi:peptidoglycan/LPS O-acetylase OafA/YrhL
MNSVKRVNQSHVLGIDALRFAAAMMVVWFHFGYLMGVLPNGTAANASRHLLAFPEVYDWSYFGWVGVEIFFVISGFVIAFSAQKATSFSFFAGRVVRLAPGVWICSTITLLTVLALGDADTAQLLRGYRHSMGFFPWGPWIDGAFWTLILEISFYLCVFVIVSLKRFDLVGAFAVVMGCCSTAFVVLRALLQAHAINQPALQALLEKSSHATDLLLLHHGVYFALGVLLWKQLMQKASARNLCWIAVFAGAGCLEVAVQASGAEILGWRSNVLVVCAVWCAGVLGVVLSVRFNAQLHRAPQWVLRAMKSIGLMTFPLYLLHMIFGATIMGRLVMLGLSRWAALAAGMAIILLAVFVISTWIEPALQRLVKRVLQLARERWQARGVTRVRPTGTTLAGAEEVQTARAA